MADVEAFFRKRDALRERNVRKNAEENKKKELINFLDEVTDDYNIKSKIIPLINLRHITSKNELKKRVDDFKRKGERELKDKLKKELNYNVDSFPNYNLFDEEFVTLNKNNKIFVSPRGICYLSSYIPTNIRDTSYSFNKELTECIEFSEKIIDFKNGGYDFLDELLEAIMYICESYFKDVDKISLVAVPSSKESKVKDSQSKKPITEIIKLYNMGELEYKYNFIKILSDESDLLKRCTEIEEHKFSNDRWDKNIHFNTISCSKKLNHSTGFIILDDVTTTGTSMNSCREILINNGANEKNIICLALAETIDKQYISECNGEIQLSKPLFGF